MHYSSGVLLWASWYHILLAGLMLQAVAYIPAFLEDRAVMIKERANGLYGPTSFLIANSIVGIPFLCKNTFSVSWLIVVLISLLFSVVTYWLINLRPGPIPFFNYLAILNLDLLAAESLVVLISSVFPIFVVALALTAFANGLWMSVGGFFVSPTVLNVFWKYTFYQFDYQRYAFSALVRNQMVGSVYECGSECECMYVTSLAGQCMIDGAEAAETLGYITKITLSYVWSPFKHEADSTRDYWLLLQLGWGYLRGLRYIFVGSRWDFLEKVFLYSNSRLSMQVPTRSVHSFRDVVRPKHPHNESAQLIPPFHESWAKSSNRIEKIYEILG